MDLTIRPFRPVDLPALLKHANDPAVSAILADVFPTPYTEEAGCQFMEDAIHK